MTIQKLIPDFEKYVIETQKKWKTPGLAVGITQNNKIIYRQGFGVKQLGTKDLVTPATIFQIGSISKSFTATLVAILVHEGKLKWHDKVIDVLPDFRMYDPWVTREFTVEDLLNHRTGLPFGVGLYLPFFGFDQNHLIHVLRYIKPASSFRLNFCYQNVPYIVAGKVIEKITGKSWESNLQERIFKPLKMTSSSANFDAFKNSPHSTHLHTWDGDQVIPIPMDWSYHDWIDVFGAGAGINSNIDDVLKWLNFQLDDTAANNKILPHAEKLRLHIPTTPANDQTLIMIDPKKWNIMTHYGLGWVCGDAKPCNIVYHVGGSLGNVTMAAFIPEEKLCITFLTNARLLHAVALLRDLYDRYFGQRQQNWSETIYTETQKTLVTEKKPPKSKIMHDLTKFAGIYHSDIYGNVTVKKNQGNLMLTIGPRKVKFDLVPWGNNTFKMLWSNEAIVPSFMGNNPTFANFVCNHNNQVITMSLTLLNYLDGLGEFKKE